MAPTAAQLIAQGFKQTDWSLVGQTAFGFVTSTSGSTITGATVAPTAGQLDVLFLTMDVAETVAAADISPGTWTAAHAASGTAQNAYAFYRVADGTEGAGLKVVAGTGTLNASAHWSRWAGGLGASPLDVFVAGSLTATKAIASTASGALASVGELVLCYAGLNKTNAAITTSAPVWTGGFTALNTTAGIIRQGSNDSSAVWAAYIANAAKAGPTAGMSCTAGANFTEIQPLIVSFKPIAPATGIYTLTSGTALATVQLGAGAGGGVASIGEATAGTVIAGADWTTLANILGPLGCIVPSSASVDANGLVFTGATL